MKALLTTYWRPLLWVFLVTAGGTIAFYTYSVNAPAIVKKAFGEDGATAATWVNLLALIFLMAIQPIGGLISDRVGRKPLLVFFGIGGVLYTWVLITYLPQTTSAVTAFLLTAVGYVILTGYTSVNAIVKAEVFPARVRALGVGLGYALSHSIFGGTAPVICQASPPPAGPPCSSSTSPPSSPSAWSSTSSSCATARSPHSIGNRATPGPGRRAGALAATSNNCW